MKKAGRIITAPFRAIARLLKRLVVGIATRVRALRPPVRIALLGGLIVVVLVAVVVLKPGPSDDSEVRETLDDFAAATRDKDYQKICDDILSSQLVEQIRSAGLPCEVALQTGLEERQNPQLRVLALEVNGDRAAARVRSTAQGEVASVDTLKLVKEGDEWRVDSLAGTAAAGSTP